VTAMPESSRANRRSAVEVMKPRVRGLTDWEGSATRIRNKGSYPSNATFCGSDLGRCFLQQLPVPADRVLTAGQHQLKTT